MDQQTLIYIAMGAGALLLAWPTIGPLVKRVYTPTSPTGPDVLVPTDMASDDHRIRDLKYAMHLRDCCKDCPEAVKSFDVTIIPHLLGTEGHRHGR